MTQWSSEKGCLQLAVLLKWAINVIGVSRVQKYILRTWLPWTFSSTALRSQWYIKQMVADQSCHVYASECKDFSKNTTITQA